MNIPADSLEDYFQRTVTVPFLDNVCSQMEEWFSGSFSFARLGTNSYPSKLSLILKKI